MTEFTRLPDVWLWNKIRFSFNDFDDDRLWGPHFNKLRARLDTQLWDRLGSHIRQQLDEDHEH